MISVSVAQKETMKKEIKELLITGNYQHAFAKITDNSMRTLKSIDLIQIYQLLINNIIQERPVKINIKITKRPHCPITGEKEMNKARIGYKVNMIEYLKQFGINFTENAPCNDPPAILEALANYCEKNIIVNNEPDEFISIFNEKN